MKMRFFILTVLLNSCSSIGTYESISYKENEYKKESISDIVSTPNLYHNKTIELDGYFYHGLEYTSIAEEKYSDPSKSIWISFNFRDDLLNNQGGALFKKNRLEKSSGKKIRIKGVFTRDKKGHLGIYAGSLTDITYFGDSE